MRSPSIDDVIAAHAEYDELRQACKTVLQRSSFAREPHKLEVEWDIEIADAYPGDLLSADCSISGVVCRRRLGIFGRKWEFEASADLPSQKERGLSLKPGDVVRVRGTVHLGSVLVNPDRARCHIVDGLIVADA